jgi:hypothetical protein
VPFSRFLVSSYQNGYKHWISGWFRDRSLVINDHPWRSPPIEKRLVSFVHYSSDALSDDDVVLIRIGNLYLQYNRAKLYNVDTDLPDTVTITYAASEEDASDRLAALSDGERWAYRNWDDGHSLVVQVCSMEQFESASQFDFAIVRIYMDDGVHDWSTCNSEYIPQSLAPGGGGGGDDDTTNSSISNNSTSTRNHSSSTGGQPIVDMDDMEADNETTVISSDKNQTSTADPTKEEIVKGTVVLAIATIGAFLVTFIGAYCVFSHHCGRRKGPDPNFHLPPPKTATNIIHSKKTASDLLKEPTTSLDDDDDEVEDLFGSNITNRLEI